MRDEKGYDFESVKKRNQREDKKRREHVVIGMAITFGIGCFVFALMFMAVRLAQFVGITF